MGTGYPQPEKTGATIALYFAVCMFVCGLFGFGFYNMLQPRRFPNPGLTAYKPPPATVIEYADTTKSAYAEAISPGRASEELCGYDEVRLCGATSPERATEELSHDTPDETTGRAAQVTEPGAPVAPMPVGEESAGISSGKI